MTRRTKEIYKKSRKPVIAIICEGRNQTETKFFRHFQSRENKYNLKIFSSESTDPSNMTKKAKQIIKENELDNEIGDRVFCLIDLDLSITQLNKVEREKYNQHRTKCKIEYILSNPCFEIWLLYYFTDSPRVENSSQKVKEQLKHYVPNYTESYDIIQECELQEKHACAINRSDKRNLLTEGQSLLNRNPYTEMQELLDTLIQYNK